MTAAMKAFLLALKNKKVSKAIISTIVVIVFVVTFTYSLLDFSGGNSALAEAANAEYTYWRYTQASSESYSCQGEKYCKHFNSTIVDWCCYFVGYCIDKAELELEDCGFSPSATTWVSNLKKVNKIKNSGEYSPQKGNLIFFNYNGRSHYKVTNKVAHIGIVTEVYNDTITVIAGNEYNSTTSNWSTVSTVNKYSVNINNDSIACYGTIGTDVAVSTTKLNTTVRDIITHNEIGVKYSEISTQYGNAIANDNGAITCGVYGWHGNRALELLQRAYTINKVEIVQILSSFNEGSAILNAIKTSENWEYYIPSDKEMLCIKAVLLSSSGKEAQDSLSLEDVQEYINICTENGLTDKKVIAYCSDIINQYGNNSFNSNVYGTGNHGVLYGVNNSMTLDEIYNSKRGWYDDNFNYQNRRQWTYEYIKEAFD